MNTLSLLDYNIWFDKFNLAERTLSLIDVIEETKPDVITLQEVTKKVHEVLITTLSKFGYLNYYPKTIDGSYDCAIFSKYPIINSKKIEFENSKMNRSLRTSVIEYPLMSKDKDDLVNIEQIKVVIATAHYESLFKPKDSLIKKEQFEITKMELDNLSKEYQHIILGCDTNIITDEDKLFLTKDINWRDAWIEFGRDKEKEYTYDTETNKNLIQRGIKNLRSRVDRIIYRGDMICRKFELITDGNFIILPSDHHGLYVKLELLG